MSEHVLLRVQPGPAPPAPTTTPPTLALEAVFILVWFDEYSDSIVSVHRSLETAQAAYLDDVYPEAGPRGGKRPGRPTITWSVAPGDADHWEPSSGAGRYIERWDVRS